MYPFISGTLEVVARATSIGVKQIREACETGDLVSYWAGDAASKRIIRAADIDEWIQSLPTKRGAA